jgi:hypothetical protein
MISMRFIFPLISELSCVLFLKLSRVLSCQNEKQTYAESVHNRIMDGGLLPF